MTQHSSQMSEVQMEIVGRVVANLRTAEAPLALKWDE